MQLHLDVVMVHSTKYTELIIIEDGVKGLGVSHCGKKRQTVCMYPKQHIFSFCFNCLIIFQFFLFFQLQQRYVTVIFVDCLSLGCVCSFGSSIK